MIENGVCVLMVFDDFWCLRVEDFWWLGEMLVNVCVKILVNVWAQRRPGVKNLGEGWLVGLRGVGATFLKNVKKVPVHHRKR